MWQQRRWLEQLERNGCGLGSGNFLGLALEHGGEQLRIALGGHQLRLTLGSRQQRRFRHDEQQRRFDRGHQQWRFGHSRQQRRLRHGRQQRRIVRRFDGGQQWRLRREHQRLLRWQQ